MPGVVLQFMQSLVVLLLAPAYAGFLARAEAIVESRRGPSVFQPYYDIAKQLRKQSAISENASWVFRGAPFVAFSGYLAVSVIVPIITDDPLPLAFLGDLIGGAFVLMLASFAITLAALDTASPFGGLGASRTTWVGSLGEPCLILVFFTVAALSNSDNPYLENHAVAGSLAFYTLPTHLLGLVAFFMIVLAENGRIPVDSPATSTEISMIEESRVLEYSGPEYAIVKWGSWMKLFLLSAIFMNVFVIPWGLGSATSILGGLQGTGALIGKLAVCGIVIVVIDTSFAKLRFFRIAEYLGGSFLLALIGIVTGYVIRK
jgi:formate hydrogenlyase subunit 4